MYVVSTEVFSHPSVPRRQETKPSNPVKSVYLSRQPLADRRCRAGHVTGHSHASHPSCRAFLEHLAPFKPGPAQCGTTRRGFRGNPATAVFRIETEGLGLPCSRRMQKAKKARLIRGFHNSFHTSFSVRCARDSVIGDWADSDPHLPDGAACKHPLSPGGAIGGYVATRRFQEVTAATGID